MKRWLFLLSVTSVGFSLLRSCSSSLTDVVRSNGVVIMVLRGRGYCMVNIGECILLDV